MVYINISICVNILRPLKSFCGARVIAQMTRAHALHAEGPGLTPGTKHYMILPNTCDPCQLLLGATPAMCWVLLLNII